MPRNKEHGLRHGLSANFPIKVMCEWQDCEQQFEQMNTLTSHVTKHLEEVLLTSEPRPADGTASEDFHCQWKDCLSETGRDFIDLVRHVYFHAFHAKLKSYGRTIVDVNELEECGLEATSRNMIPELPDRLQCGWKDCQLVSDNPDYFYKHVTSHIENYENGNHLPDGALCLWEGCEMKTKSKYKLREHLRSHTQEKVIACPTCGGLFANTTKMFDHLQRQIQSTVQTYQCSHCNKRCPTERLLRDHMRHHVNHYKCPFCDMTCPNPSGLRAHIKYRHSEEKPYTCSECEYKGKTFADLRRHSVIHTTETTVFRCHIDDCPFEGKSYFSLTIHFKMEHQGACLSKYQCHLCQNAFTRGTSLTRHLKKQHKFKWPSGHKRFRYKLNDDGVHRLQTVRYESIELTEQLLSDKIGVGVGPAGDTDNTQEEEVPLRTSTPEPPEGSTDEQLTPAPQSGSPAPDPCYNLQMLGDVALKLPKGRFLQAVEKSRKRKREDGTAAGSDDGMSGFNSDQSDVGDFSDAWEGSNCGTSVRYSESECGRSEYTPSEFGGVSEYPPSESCYMGSERYAESELDPLDSEASSVRPTPMRMTVMEPSPHLDYSSPYLDQPLDLTDTHSHMPPMYGPAAQSVAYDFSSSMFQSLQPSREGMKSPPNTQDIHHLQPLPTSIEETTRLLAS